MKSFLVMAKFSATVIILVWITGGSSVEKTCPATVTGPFHDGKCPELQTGVICKTCKDNCTSDITCPKEQKCCSFNDCGNRCVDATYDSPPPPTPYSSDMDYTKSSKPSTCNAHIYAPHKPGTCDPPQDGIFCFVCNDQCRTDYDCGYGEKKCCPTVGCGNNCTFLFH